MRQLLQADEPADAVVDVHDEVADLQVAKIGDEGSRRRAAALVGAALLLEQVGFGEELEAGCGQVKPLGELAGGDEHGGVREVVGLADGAGAHVVIGEQLERALGAAGRGRHEHRQVAAIARLANFLDPVADPAAVFQTGGTGNVRRSGAGDSPSSASSLMRRPEPSQPATSSQVQAMSSNGGTRRPRDCHVRRAGAPLLLERAAARLDVVDLEDHQIRAGQPHVVDDGRGPVEGGGVVGGARVGQQLSLRNDIDRDRARPANAASRRRTAARTRRCRR